MKRKNHRKIYIILLIFLVFLSGMAFFSSTPKIKDKNGKLIHNSIAVLEKVKVGGIDQYLLIRGRDKSNPVILFIHGGPGYAQISYARKYQKSLEDDFVVVNWDQRGAGKSYSTGINENTMILEQFLSDTNEIVDYLRDKFDRDKIYLAGHSWGSVLGILTAYRNPEKFYAYIGIGQSINYIEGERISYNYVFNRAVADNNERALNELKEIGYPPYTDIYDLMKQRKWLAYYGGVERKVDTLKDLIIAILFSNEYSWLDGIKFYLGNNFSMKTISSSFNYIKSGEVDINLFKQVPELKIPAYFCMGKHDYNTPYTLVVKYYKSLQAPLKKLYWFEESAHFPHFEEPEKFFEVMHKILIETYPFFTYFNN